MDLASAASEPGHEARPGSDPAGWVRVWDPLVRLFHWSLVATFAFAFLTAEEWDAGHEAAGYVVAGLIAFRVLWGIVGPRHARFADFLYRPATVIAFVRDSLRMRAARYLGHNPAGGLMVIALLLMLGIITGTGHLMTTDAFWGVKWVKELHELAANLTLGLIALHLLGVLLTSVEHGENLVRAMISGRKRR
jgi:cytochrome b